MINKNKSSVMFSICFMDILFFSRQKDHAKKSLETTINKTDYSIG